MTTTTNRKEMKLKAFKPLDHDISDPVFAAGLSLSKQSHASNLKKITADVI